MRNIMHPNRTEVSSHRTRTPDREVGGNGAAGDGMRWPLISGRSILRTNAAVNAATILMAAIRSGREPTLPTTALSMGRAWQRRAMAERIEASRMVKSRLVMTAMPAYVVTEAAVTNATEALPGSPMKWNAGSRMCDMVSTTP